jgi:hypothetical protein
MIRKFLVFSDNQHDYTITTEEEPNGDKLHILYNSHGEQWGEIYRGKEILRIFEGDLEMTIITDIRGIKAFHEVVELQLLLNFITSDYEPNDFKVIEEKDVKTFN